MRGRSRSARVARLQPLNVRCGQRSPPRASPCCSGASDDPQRPRPDSHSARQHDHATLFARVSVCFAEWKPAWRLIAVLGGLIHVILHCCRLCHSAAHEKTGPSWCVQLGVYGYLGRPLQSGQLGRWDARRQRIALCATRTTRCVCGSSTTTFSSCVQAACACRSVCPHACLRRWLGSGAVLGRPVQLRGLWFGPHGP